MDMPEWMKDCPLAFDWCSYKGRVYFASLNYEESKKRNKPVFDLAYCATKAMNGLFLTRRVWNKDHFKRTNSSISW